MTIRPHRDNLGECHRVAVVVASTDACTIAPECLARFAAEVRGRGEVVLVDATRDGANARDVASIRVIRRPPGTLAPELWGVGLRATDAPLVAFSTAAMVPAPGWLDALLARLDESDAAAVGGPIEPAQGLTAIDRAVSLLRYGNYLRPLPDSADPEPPGDNALYRRGCLRELGAVIDRGFWESEIHRRLRARGERLAMADGAAVTFHGGCRPVATLVQRFRHARRYGASRATMFSPIGRLFRVTAAPAVPMVLLTRAALTLRRRGRSIGPWISAAPAMIALTAIWAAGEACGLIAGHEIQNEAESDRGGRAHDGGRAAGGVPGGRRGLPRQSAGRRRRHGAGDAARRRA